MRRTGTKTAWKRRRRILQDRKAAEVPQVWEDETHKTEICCPGISGKSKDNCCHC